MTVGNFEVHLKNRQHRERVDGRVGVGTSTQASSSGSGF
jgi:SWI/SNF-related matrix-associated actin-dependent regulator of chromatin subfamily B protein 1